MDQLQNDLNALTHDKSHANSHLHDAPCLRAAQQKQCKWNIARLRRTFYARLTVALSGDGSAFASGQLSPSGRSAPCGRLVIVHDCLIECGHPWGQLLSGLAPHNALLPYLNSEPAEATTFFFDAPDVRRAAGYANLQCRWTGIPRQ